MINWNEIPAPKGEPDFNNLLSVLQKQVPVRPTLFEFFLNERLYNRVAPDFPVREGDPLSALRRVMAANTRLGYDYLQLLIPNFSFQTGARHKDKSQSMNEGAVIRSRADFDAYAWPNPYEANYGILDQLALELPKGMRLIPYSPDGVLENAVDLVGYETLCKMIKDDAELAFDIFEQVGSRLQRYYEIVARHPAVGACISNDDWGFKTQTMFSPRDMRRFVFPWHQRIVESVHAAGKPVFLHSCGHYDRIINDIIEGMKYDGRHSYEDTILPVEQAYEACHGRLAVIGGIDVDFICRRSPEEVYRRSQAMLQQSSTRGGYAHGSGNSIPDYVPDSGYFAMIRAALELR